jgi:hypothetical protein
MENSRKHLKINSIVVLILTLSSIFDIASGLIDIKNAAIPDGAPNNILEITQIFIIVVACVLLLPQIYIGFKGLKVAKNPDSSKGHIVWATILFVAALLSLASSIMEGVQNGFNQDVVLSALSIAVDVLVYFDYIKAANLVANGN